MDPERRSEIWEKPNFHNKVTSEWGQADPKQIEDGDSICGKVS